MSRFFNQLADKAQSAINASPLAGHLPPSVTNALNSQTTGSQQQPSVQTGGAPVGSPAGGGRHYAIDNLQHSFLSSMGKLRGRYNNEGAPTMNLSRSHTARFPPS
ncbi:hypothetical protein EXIGLDRAFT_828213 [Exidia glandulosa HHB12029]|uniref:Uncharacterized protein n=1 Tax=Exidia glandulosa HHB12029 TaxID=1314781 RepID=A0A165R0S0_EXIGL|nr:hypothetical protein EXIGLDRAFT_828213 [Exidia glandulosa HHB12029]